MKNAMQLKALIKKIAKEKQLSAQVVMQNYMFERLLERISLSSYCPNFILKGGLLIASMVGIQSRATMDMDATIRNFPVNEDSIQTMFMEITEIPLNDDVNFTLGKISRIREGDEYDGYRVSLTANFLPMRIPLKLDVTTGDKITPSAIKYEYPLMFESRFLNIWSYNMETILAEKLETIISRGDQNTRLRDYYDTFILYTLKNSQLDAPLLHESLIATSKKRQSYEIMSNHREIIDQIKNNRIMQGYWNLYQKDYEYARGIDFIAICEVIEKILGQVI